MVRCPLEDSSNPKHPPVSQAIVSELAAMLECLPHSTMCKALICFFGMILSQHSPGLFFQLFFFPSEEQGDGNNLKLLNEFHEGFDGGMNTHRLSIWLQSSSGKCTVFRVKFVNE